jgi:hypothetical protein
MVQTIREDRLSRIERNWKNKTTQVITENGGFKPRGNLVISVGSYVVLNIWKRNLHGRYNPYGKSFSVGAFGHI